MSTLPATNRIVDPPRPLHWLGEPVDQFSGRVEDVTPHLPTFDRLPFGTNRRRDMIVRPAAKKGDMPIPIETVSKQYVLVQHQDAVDALVQAVLSVGIDPAKLRCRLRITESGSRMLLRVQLPRELAFEAGDGHVMALTFECFNSVDRTVPFLAVLGWLRFVCSNGLVIGTTHAKMRSFHLPPLDIKSLQPMLIDGLEAAREDCKRLTGLMHKPVSVAALREWVDGPVADTWGPFAAARVYSVATSGRDGVPSPRPVHAKPHQREILRPTPVPGANAPSRDRYGVTQALAWVAALRRDIAQSVQWRSQIDRLVEQLR